MLEIGDSLESLAPELPERVLREPFTTKPGGWGLGLMFVRMVVARHGGSIGCRAGPRGGLVFTLRLPSGGR
jgi:signal transduction histidine kinase